MGKDSPKPSGLTRTCSSWGQNPVYGNPKTTTQTSFLRKMQLLFSRYRQRLYFGDTEEERLEYKLGIAFMLASDFGVKRIFSTFFSRWRPFDHPDWDFPDPNLPFACGSETDFYTDTSLENTYVCQHRWEVVRAMVTFANHVQGASVEMIRSTPDAISFSRGRKGFFAMGSGLTSQSGEKKKQQ